MRKLWTAKSAAMSLLMLALAGCTFCPQPITQCDRAERIAQDKQDMFACQEPIKGVISLSEAMARSLKYNLDLRLKTADSILARSDYSVTKFDMLPDFVASAGYLSRSNEYAVKTDPNSDIVSFSQDRHRRVADLQLTWNILDFGVSYVLAKQKGDQFLISIERRRKMEQNIERDVRYAYFRAVSAQRVIRKIDPLMSQVKRALSKSRHLETEQTQSPLEALRYQKSLLSTLRQLTTLRKELANAKRELASLMNVAPGQNFRVSEDITSLEVLPRGFPLKMSRLEYLALQHRPEIREEDYRTRISANEITKAKLRMFPGLELTTGGNTDSNSFLVYNNWANVGAQLTWNLMRIFSGPANIERAKRELLVSNVRRMALSMAILTQVDVAYLRYRETRKELDVSENEKEVTTRIYRKVSQGFAAKKMSEMELIRAKTDMILSMLRYDLTYAEWQNSAGQVLNSVGYDLLPILDTTQPVRVIRRQLHAALNTEPTWLLRQHVASNDSVQSAKPALRAVIAKDGSIKDIQTVASNTAPTTDSSSTVVAKESQSEEAVATIMASLWALPVSVDTRTQALKKTNQPAVITAKIALPEPSPLRATSIASNVQTPLDPMMVAHTNAMIASMLASPSPSLAPMATPTMQREFIARQAQRSASPLGLKKQQLNRSCTSSSSQSATRTQVSQRQIKNVVKRVAVKQDVQVQLPAPAVHQPAPKRTSLKTTLHDLPTPAAMAQLPSPDITHREAAHIATSVRHTMVANKNNKPVSLTIPTPHIASNTQAKKQRVKSINHKLDWIAPQEPLSAAVHQAKQPKKVASSLAQAAHYTVPTLIDDVSPRFGAALKPPQMGLAKQKSQTTRVSLPRSRHLVRNRVSNRHSVVKKTLKKPVIQAKVKRNPVLPSPKAMTTVRQHARVKTTLPVMKKSNTKKQVARTKAPRQHHQVHVSAPTVKTAITVKTARSKPDYAAQEAAAIEHHARLQHHLTPKSSPKKVQPRMHFEVIDPGPEDDTETV